jgi:hypothetical protein
MLIDIMHLLMSIQAAERNEKLYAIQLNKPLEEKTQNMHDAMVGGEMIKLVDVTMSGGTLTARYTLTHTGEMMVQAFSQGIVTGVDKAMEMSAGVVVERSTKH